MARDTGRAATDWEDGTRLSATDLVLRYPDGEKPVINGASVTVPAGEITALLGPNGCGKSTLLRGLAAHLPLEAGDVVLDGRAIAEYEDKALARRLGVLQQETAGPDALTVEELVYRGRYPHRSIFEGRTEDDVQAVEQALDLAGVAGLRDRPLGDLSGGQRQLAWIAMVLAQDTEVLLLDEPTTFLDLKHQLTVMDVVRRLREKRDLTIVVVLHDVEQAARYADSVVVLSDGRVRAHGSPETVVTAELLAAVFDIEAHVETTERGLSVTPIKPL